VRSAFVAAAVLAITLVAPALSVAQPTNVRLSNDNASANYISLYTQNTGVAYDDGTLAECRVAHGRQNEPSVAIDPRNPSVILGSSNDYCGVYQPAGAAVQQPTGPIWLGYYRSQDGGQSFRSSLVPGYPLDTSPYAALAQIRTASSGDPVIAWDGHGRAFFGSESSDDPAGTKKTFGDVFVATFDNPQGESGLTVNDGKRFVGAVVVEQGTSAPNLLGKFNDKTAIEADRTGTSCDGNVYFAWSRFTANGSVAIYVSRSTDHGATWSPPKKLSSASDVQFPDISVTGNGHVYVTWRTFMAKKHDSDSIQIAKSTDCGATFAPAATVGTFVPNDAVDVAAPKPIPTQSAADDPRSDAAPTSRATPSSAGTRRCARRRTRTTSCARPSTSCTTPPSPVLKRRPARPMARTGRASPASRARSSPHMTARPARPRRRGSSTTRPRVTRSSPTYRSTAASPTRSGGIAATIRPTR